MRRRTAAIVGISAVAAVVFFLFAPVVYSPTNVYEGTFVASSGCVWGNTPYVCTAPVATYPNWNSLSCWAFGFGVHYGLTVYQPGDSYQSGCYPPYFFWSSV